MTSVSVFGLGKVGHTLACCLAAAGNRVIGYDPVPEIVNAVNDGTYQSLERDVADRLASAGPDQFKATSSSDEAVHSSDVSLVIVPTPSNSLGGFSLRYALDACRSIGTAIKNKPAAHFVALVSTVLPGASDRYIMPALELSSGRRIGNNLGYCYNPSFIALGEVVNGFERPDYVLVGQADEKSGDAIEALHRSMMRNDTPVVRMKPIEAEIAKIASNTHETMRVTFANMLFSLCSEVPDADVDIITGALGHRMGRRFFKGAVPYGGPCWPRDNRALAVFMDAVGVPSVMPRTVDISNEEHGKYILRKIFGATSRGDTVGLLGLSYKPNTQVIDGSFGIALAEWLLADGRNVVAWDPLASNEARQILGDRIHYALSPEQCLRSASVTMIINPMRAFETVSWTAASNGTVLDPWRCLSPAQASEIGSYIPMGRGNGITMAEWLSSSDLAEKLRLLNS